METKARLVDHLLAGAAAMPGASSAALAESLVRLGGDDDEHRAPVLDAIGRAARLLSPDGHPPATATEAVAWAALVSAADRLGGSGVRPLGRPAFLSDALLRALVEEAWRQMPGESGTGRRTGAPGDVLATLAVSRQLTEAVSDALGFPAAPTYDALYELDPAGSHVATHLDSRDYPIAFHLLLEQERSSSGSGESVLVAHLPGMTGPQRICLKPGEALVLRGRGTIHSWQALAENERRVLAAVGFAPETRAD